MPGPDEIDEVTQRRRHVATLVRGLYEGRLGLAELFRQLGEVDLTADPQLAELLRLVASEPTNTWLFGISGEAAHQNARRIRQLVEQFAR